MQGNGYIIIYTELMITAIFQDFVPLGKIVNLMKLENFGMNDRIFGETGHRDGTEQVMGQEKKALLKLSLRELKINKVHLPYLLKKFFVNKSGCFGRLCSC